MWKPKPLDYIVVEDVEEPWRFLVPQFVRNMGVGVEHDRFDGADFMTQWFWHDAVRPRVLAAVKNLNYVGVIDQSLSDFADVKRVALVVQCEHCDFNWDRDFKDSWHGV